jgi:hypothetical protein
VGTQDPQHREAAADSTSTASRRAPKRSALIGLAIGLIGVGATVAAAVMGARSPDDGTADRAQVMLRMQYYNQTLGVDCTYCHVPNKFTIETPRMRTTRWMEEHLVGSLVTRETHEQIDCHTCHDGRARFLPSSP